MRRAVVAAAVAALGATVSADTCASVAATSSIQIKKQLDIGYATEQANYWSTACGAMKPSCQLYPTTADEVAAIVRILNANNETFAVKSGGHSPNQGFASIDGGPLISTRELNEVIYDAGNGVVRVGPGNDWDDVIGALDGTGVTVVGGRIGDVGVGGLVLGGGLSFLSTQYGWVANNVVEYEIVLANASIVTASESHNADLWKALKGGINNYGIVTAYTFKAHPQGQIWGGNIAYTADKSAEILAAVRDFTEYYPDDKAGIIMTAELTQFGVIDIWLMFLFYDGPTPPAGVFDNFTAIAHLSDDTKSRSYSDLLTHNNFGVIKTEIYTIATEMIPLPSADVGPDFLGAIYDNWRNTTESVIDAAGLIGSIALQPIPKRLARKAMEAGGDMIDLDDEIDRIILEFDLSWLSPLDSARMDVATQKFYTGSKDLVEQYQADDKLPEGYLPLFANDAYYRQDYFGRLRTADFARTVRDAVDPSGFFASRTGGWKP
ncbi:FAD binding domain-containing protein [Paraphaeosphaeria sporulosa]